MYAATYISRVLRFKFPAGTSRGVLHEKYSWFILLSLVNKPGISGIGECSLIPGLSYDDRFDFEPKLEEVCDLITAGEKPEHISLEEFPSIRFGLETAMKDLETGGGKILYQSSFTDGKAGIPVNGLIWMDNKERMMEQINNKISSGFRIIKLKVGAINFKDELEILHRIRTRYDMPEIEIRLDANGAWGADEALEKIDRLSEYHIHSIEQPIKAGNPEEIGRICRESPVEIALDEELIGIFDRREKESLLKTVRPAYIILKPGLLGGFAATGEWIEIAEKLEIGWWITSALESNIGLNAIAQWTAGFDPRVAQGLGTGQLFENNIPSPLEIRGDRLWHNPANRWDLSVII